MNQMEYTITLEWNAATQKQITTRICDLFYHAEAKCVSLEYFSFSIFVDAIYTWDFIKCVWTP